MEIIKADKAGFCFGVERAVAIAREALEGKQGQVSSLGPIIHNPQVVADLEEAGLRVAGSLEDVPGGLVVIRSHGAPPAIYREAELRGLGVLDATCPFVKNMHQLARGLARDGYQVVLVGERDHPEVTSLLEDPDCRPLVVCSAEEVRGMRLRKKVGLLSQTTQTAELFRAVADALLPRVRELRIYNTICDSTRLRQEESLEIARRVDLMIVIGGRNSANTRRLVGLCGSCGTVVHHVEVPEELQAGWFQGVDRVGVTAGASTPGRLIDRVVEKIKTLNPGSK